MSSAAALTVESLRRVYATLSELAGQIAEKRVYPARYWLPCRPEIGICVHDT